MESSRSSASPTTSTTEDPFNEVRAMLHEISQLTDRIRSRIDEFRQEEEDHGR